MTASTIRRTAAARSRLAAVSAIAVAGALMLTGCGDQTKEGKEGGGSESAAATKAPLFDALPKSIQDKGVIKVGSDIAYAPVEFKDESGKTVGIDPDLADAMGKQLGVKFEFENGTFDTLLTGLRSKRYDIAMSAMTDTKDRQEGVDSETGKKVGEGVDFVDYFTAGVSIYTKKGDTQGIETWSDLCGKKIALQRGTVSHDLAKAEAKKCDKAGKGKLSIEAFDNDQQAQTRLRAGGADAGSSDFPVAAYAVKTSGGGKDFELVGEQVEAAPYGIAVAKSNAELRDAIQKALDAIIKDGTYKKVIDEWGVAEGAVTEAKINGGS
ncbi:ABC transporter substrate-binding protein [Streptomyces sp. GC420]|uniref:ABC transporter substrate-binding protein n=1 Tax=Streptomyces sp. GC420 TaxID=2697568 RepID=UPI00141502ED|nr:ABC transporter substrate-binding protein [Streptomyces sp. GC420]NBM19660.1 transporter substrate-binding domain-containing protein [Streptomyces sp. GC420]